MTALKDYDKNYRDSLTASFNLLELTYQEILKNYSFDLNKIEITDAILERLKAYYLTQNKIKLFLAKRYATAASDFFVESVLFFLELFFESTGNKFKAHSERQIKRIKKALRPDISIWDGEKIVAIIECKTQFGWNRKNWEEDFMIREAKLKVDFPNAKSFLLILTSRNWSLIGSNKFLKKKYFILLNNTWPTEYIGSDQILTPIEDLFKQL